ncbi:hypothetical protein JGY90_10230 [Staphylococcus xylosus]|uniref:hypothetical protein n=1 Tax=Staphylococcus xylosus TaxID=1288 RepID=UPI001CDBD309|nr:hypothetical protein [Staphylococcus xylosus]UBV34080.1 hypothetical protein JGY90_10230 [Staphylococcus xylosus]
MAYDVDFWYISQDACQISTDFTPFSEHEKESIYMKTSDSFEMIERFTDPDLEHKAKAWDNYIAEVRERVRFTENTEDDIESETQKVIDYYMEDE